jgi:hypothetical protein
MAVQTTTRWRVPVEYYADIEAFVDGAEVVIAQGEGRISLKKAACADLIEAIRLAAEAAPKDSEEIPF